MRTILSFDTSADFCAAALVRDAKELAHASLPMSRGHAEALIPLVRGLCEDAEVRIAGLDLIAVTIGPGSFTGVRTGIAAAKGFALAADCPAVGVSSMQAVATAAVTEKATPVLVALDTRRADYYVQLFDAKANPMQPPSVTNTDVIEELIRIHRPVVAGNAVPRLCEESGISQIGGFETLPGDGVPDPVVVARLAENILNTQGVASDALSPLYLRAPEAKIPPAGGRLKDRTGA